MPDGRASGIYTKGFKKDSFDHYISPMKGLDKILDPKHWLEDDEINKACALIQQHYPRINGLQDVCVVTAGQGIVVSSPMLQIMHSHTQHWVTVSTIGCANDTIRLFDSMYMDVDRYCVNNLIHLMAFKEQTGLTIEVAKFQRQRSKADCGLFAIAAAFSLVLGQNPSEVCYDRELMRAHLHNCLKTKTLTDFPKFAGQPNMKLGRKYKVYMCCACTQAILNNAQQCGVCRRWCHSERCLSSVSGLATCSNCAGQ